MGLSGIHMWELVLVLVVVLLLFGSKRLPGIASDLGAALRGFRKSFSEDQETPRTWTGRAGERDHRDRDSAPPPSA